MTSSTSSLYAVINYKGVSPVFIPGVSKLAVPPRINVFLWLVSYNKIMTRDNLIKRNMNKATGRVFCAEPESVQYLFFDCIVAQLIWKEFSSFFPMPIGFSVESITTSWVAGKKLDSLNTIVAAVLWSLWKLRNGIVFNGVVWLSLNQVWLLILRTLENWRLIYKEYMMEQIGQFYVNVQTLLRSVARLKWGG